MPTRPKLATAAASHVQFKAWDQWMEEALEGIEPYFQPMPPTEDDPEPKPLEVPCPTSDQLRALPTSQGEGSDEAAFVMLFGEEAAPRLLLATGGKAFVLRSKMIASILMHYNIQAIPNQPGVPSPE